MEDVVRSPSLAFWSKQRLLLTGHTGFKGAWLALWLEQLGAHTTGFALAPDTTPSLSTLAPPQSRFRSLINDISDRGAVAEAVGQADPTIAIHMAAQPFVRRSFREPVETFTTNVMGTVHLLEALRAAPNLQAIVVVTTDKVYRNADEGRDFVEDDPLGGHDPYSASKAAAEIAAASWASSFFGPREIRLATARAGNVIGGGDWSEDRIIPDIWRAARNGERPVLRYPQATRPWQHVLDALCGYLLYAEDLCDKRKTAPAALNFGPLPGDTLTVAQVTEAVQQALGGPQGWALDAPGQPPEMRLLSLDPSRAIHALGWRPRFTCREALEATARWYRDFSTGEEARKLCLQQIGAYASSAQKHPAEA